ncbi:MAG: ABC transporter ATP-binding protein [Dehalococcoidia bacterium]|nr:ABC transporter ATP-binding protein [Dehalococcoidia bacterium]
MSQDAAISVRSLVHRYPSPQGEVLALDGVSLSVRPGEFVSIIGRSGCGKTTLLKAIGGLLAPSSGDILVHGEPPKSARRRKQTGFVFQDGGLLPWRTVLENVRLPLEVNTGASIAAAQDPEALVHTVGLSDFSRYYPHQLSGGMRQRVALARALVFSPSLLLMDEPLGALDELTRRAMRFELLRIWEASRTTVLMVTHSVAEAVLLSDRVLVMTGAPGRIAGEVTIALPRPRPSAIERSPEFLDCASRVENLLSLGGPVGAAHR